MHGATVDPDIYSLYCASSVACAAQELMRHEYSRITQVATTPGGYAALLARVCTSSAAKHAAHSPLQHITMRCLPQRACNP